MRYPTANFRRVAERVRFRPAPHCGPCARDDGVSSTRADTGDDGDRRTASSAISIGLHACGPVAARVVGTLFACSSSSSTGFMPPVIGKISFLNVMTIGFTTTTVRQNGGQLELQRSHLYRRQRSSSIPLRWQKIQSRIRSRTLGFYHHQRWHFLTHRTDLSSRSIVREHHHCFSLPILHSKHK